MNGYLLILLADVLLMASFVVQKIYQKKAGASVEAGLFYNVASSVWMLIIFSCMIGFHFQFSWYSVLMAFISTILTTAYFIISLFILKMGNLSLYTLFLMSGGMVLPYVFGIFFLDESVSIFRIIGILLILGAVCLSNMGTKQIDKKQILLCVLVFILNGFVSITLKLHQINDVFQTVDAQNFTIIGAILKILICLPWYCYLKNKDKEEKTIPSHQNEKNNFFKIVIVLTALSAFSGGLSSVFQLQGAIHIPASVLYPMITGGSMILTTLADKYYFHTKLTKQQIIAVIICFVGTCLFL